MAGTTSQTTLSGGVAVSAYSAFSGINAVTGADYTITDGDGYRTIDMTTGASNRTITLPTLADNVGREIIIRKADSGAGYILIDGEGAETINGQTIFYMTAQYEAVALVATTTGWAVVNFIPRGYVSALCSAATPTVSANTDVDVTGMTVTLQPGTWRLGYHMTAGVDDNSGAVNSISGRVRITDSSNNAVSGSEAFFNYEAVAANSSLYFPVSREVTVTITSATTYKVRVACGDATAAGFAQVAADSLAGALTNPDNNSTIFAQRVA